MLSFQAFVYASFFVSLALGQPLVNSFRTVALPASELTPRSLAHVSNERVHDSSSLRKRDVDDDNQKPLSRRELERRGRLTGAAEDKSGSPEWRRSILTRSASGSGGHRTLLTRNLGFTSSGDLVGGGHHAHYSASGGLLSGLGGLPVVGGVLQGGLPVVGDVLGGLPVVGGLVGGQSHHSAHAGGLLSGGLQGLPVVGGLLNGSGGLLAGLPILGGGGEVGVGVHTNVGVAAGVKES